MAATDWVLGLAQIFAPVIVVVLIWVVEVNCLWYNFLVGSSNFEWSVVVEVVINLEDAGIGPCRNNEFLIFKEFICLMTVLSLNKLWDSRGDLRTDKWCCKS